MNIIGSMLFKSKKTEISKLSNDEINNNDPKLRLEKYLRNILENIDLSQKHKVGIIISIVFIELVHLLP